MITIEHLMRRLPENVKDYLTHIGVINGKQDYLNKIFILEGLCSGEGKGCKTSAIRALNYINNIQTKSIINKN